MGADIHMYVEFRQRERPNLQTEDMHKQWSNFGSKYYVGRNYSFFGILAGVRDTRVEPIVAPRGMPEGYGHETLQDYSLVINEQYADDDGYTSPESAEQWVKGGYSKYLLNHEGKPWRVTNPDAHTHSWLTPDEYEKALGLYADTYLENFYEGGDPGLRFRVLLPMMRALEDGGKNEVRTVFWFDN